MDLMPGGSHSEAGSAAAGTKDDKRKQTIIVICSVAGVLLTYLVLKHSSNSSAGAVTGTDTAAGTSTNSTDSDGADQTQQAILGQLNNIGSSLNQLPSSIGALIPKAGTTNSTPNGGTTTTKTPTSTMAPKKAALFRQYTALHTQLLAMEAKLSVGTHGVTTNKAQNSQLLALRGKTAAAQVAYQKAPSNQ